MELLIFFNAKGNREGLSAELTNFLNYVSGKVVNDDFTRQLDDDVKRVKQDKRKRIVVRANLTCY